MKKLHVGLGKNSYDILIGENYFEKFSEYIGAVYNGQKLFVITDSNVDRIYKKEYEKMFEGFDYKVFVLQAGEKHKHIGIMPGIYSAIVNAGLTRKDIVVAFGGGVVGDIAGFAAASYMRGIGFIQIPTTIVSQVDSSVGGKVGVDLPEGKNLVGAFHQPKLVLIDNYFLNTLKQLLKETTLSVAAVCEEVGYTDLRHFTKTFVKYAELKPNEYRKLYS